MAVDESQVLISVPPSTGAIDLDDAVRRYVSDAVRNHMFPGETYWYSVAGTVVNGPKGPSPAFVVTMYARSPLVGSTLVEGAVQTGFPTMTEFDLIVSSLIEGLRRQATDALR